jgi:hypothetical protein
MSSIPMHKAGVGSAVNDTTRELGGALGVAVLGSVAVSHYASSIASKLHDVPAGLAAAASKSVGAAVQIGNEMGGSAGRSIAAAGKAAYVDAMGLALVVASGVALVAAILVGRYLPNQVVERPGHAPEAAEPVAALEP